RARRRGGAATGPARARGGRRAGAPSSRAAPAGRDADPELRAGAAGGREDQQGGERREGGSGCADHGAKLSQPVVAPRPIIASHGGAAPLYNVGRGHPRSRGLAKGTSCSVPCWAPPRSSLPSPPSRPRETPPPPRAGRPARAPTPTRAVT